MFSLSFHVPHSFAFAPFIDASKTRKKTVLVIEFFLPHNYDTMRITLIGYIFIRPENAVRPGGGSLQNTININVLTRQKKCYVCVFCICTICLFANSDKINNTKKKIYSQNRHFSFPSSKIRFIEQNFFRAFAAAFAKFASGIIFFFYIRSFRILLLCLSIFFFRKKNLIFFSEHQFDINLNYIVWMTCWLDRVRIE